MLLEPQDVEQFFRLHRTLMLFVNQRLKVIPDNLTTPEEFGAMSPEVRLKVSDALLANVDLIESFVAERWAHLSEDELDIIRSWRHLIADTLTQTKKDTRSGQWALATMCSFVPPCFGSSSR